MPFLFNHEKGCTHLKGLQNYYYNLLSIGLSVDLLLLGNHYLLVGSEGKWFLLVQLSGLVFKRIGFGYLQMSHIHLWSELREICMVLDSRKLGLFPCTSTKILVIDSTWCCFHCFWSVPLLKKWGRLLVQWWLMLSKSKRVFFSNHNLNKSCWSVLIHVQ